MSMKEPAMAEQPPSAEATELADFIRTSVGRSLSRYEAIKRIDALCEQRVSAETERCALVAENEAKDYAALYVLEGFPEDLKRRDAAERIAKRIRAPAERPAPPQPVQRSGPKGVNPCPRCTATWGQEYCKVRDCPANQQQDSARRIGVEQPTQQTGEPGCGMAETARSRAASIVGTWQDLHLYTDAALDDLEIRIAHALSPVPSAIASTGEQLASPAAVVDYTERALTVARDAIEGVPSHLLPYRINSEEIAQAIAPDITDALSAVASEHQAEIAALKAAIVKAYADALRVKAALLARLWEPDIAEAAAEAGIEAAAEAVSALPMGQRAWNTKEYKIAETAARAAITRIKGMLK
jgi:hypothetical protein